MRRSENTRVRRFVVAVGAALTSLLTLATGVLAGSDGVPFPK